MLSKFWVPMVFFGNQMPIPKTRTVGLTHPFKFLFDSNNFTNCYIIRYFSGLVFVLEIHHFKLHLFCVFLQVVTWSVENSPQMNANGSPVFSPSVCHLLWGPDLFERNFKSSLKPHFSRFLSWFCANLLQNVFVISHIPWGYE